VLFPALEIPEKASLNDLRSRGRGVEFVAMPVKEIVNRCANKRLPFDWTINPYRGCEFGCVYCYARYTHEFLDLADPMDFERRIFVKTQAQRALLKTLARSKLCGGAIALGTATDPYQPAERTYRITRQLLEVFAQTQGLELSITTKSHLILRDLDLLKAINRRCRLTVNFSLITLDRRLQRILEPRAPRPALRLRALAELSREGIFCQVLVMPVIPGLTDQRSALELVVRAARQAGASQVWWRSLFLKPAAARRFLPFVRSKLPHLAAKVDSFYSSSAYAPKAYDQQLATVFQEIKSRYGFPNGERRPKAPGPVFEAQPDGQGSLSLFGQNRKVDGDTAPPRAGSHPRAQT